MDWETIVEDYTKQFIEKGIEERTARAWAEVLADVDIDIYRTLYQTLDAQSLDVAENKVLQSFDAPNEQRLRIPDFETDK